MSIPAWQMREIEQQTLINTLIQRMHDLLPSREKEAEEFLYELAHSTLDALPSCGADSIISPAKNFLRGAMDHIRIFATCYEEYGYLMAQFFERLVSYLNSKKKQGYQRISILNDTLIYEGKRSTDELTEEEVAKRNQAMEKLRKKILGGFRDKETVWTPRICGGDPHGTGEK